MKLFRLLLLPLLLIANATSFGQDIRVGGTQPSDTARSFNLKVDGVVKFLGLKSIDDSSAVFTDAVGRAYRFKKVDFYRWAVAANAAALAEKLNITDSTGKWIGIGWLPNLIKTSDSGRAATKWVTGGSLNKVRDSLCAVMLAGLNAKQDALGFTPENIANKSNDATFASPSSTTYPTTSATRNYVNNQVSGKEDVANKSTSTSLGASNSLYPTQNAVKTYADGKVQNQIVNGVTNIAPAQDIVFDSLAALRAAIAAGSGSGGSGDVQPSSGVIFGTSLIVDFAGQNSVYSYLMTACDTLEGNTIVNHAFGGSTIAEQHDLWVADADKATYDWIVISVGANDTEPDDPIDEAMDRLQAFIDDVVSGKKASAKILLFAMTPMKQRLVDLYGSTDGATAYQKWRQMNQAIMGQGSNAILGVDYRSNKGTELLNDGNDNLADYYDVGDHCHTTNAARKIQAAEIREGLQHFGFLKCGTPVVLYDNFTIQHDGALEIVKKGSGMSIPMGLKLFTPTAGSTKPIRIISSYDSGADKAISWDNDTAGTNSFGRIRLQLTGLRTDFVLSHLYNSAFGTATAFRLQADGKSGLFQDSPTAGLHLPASTTSAASLRIPNGTAPSSPNNGDMWNDNSHLYAVIGLSTVQLDRQGYVGANEDFTYKRNAGSTGSLALGFRLEESGGGEQAVFKATPSSGEVKIGASAGYYTAIYSNGVLMKILLPISQSFRDAIPSPATGLEIYCSDCTATGGSTGVRQTWDGAAWRNSW